MKRASNDTLAGRRYLDLQREAKRAGRSTDELIQLYIAFSTARENGYLIGIAMPKASNH